MNTNLKSKNTELKSDNQIQYSIGLMYLANTFFLSRCVVSPGEEKEVCGWNSEPS